MCCWASSSAVQIAIDPWMQSATGLIAWSTKAAQHNTFSLILQLTA
jgi:hypothetical protein